LPLQAKEAAIVNRIELAQRFVQTQCQIRNDLVGAFLIGSAARGEDGAFSDIDVALVVAGEVSPTSRGDTATWQDGIFIDATIRTQRYYADVEEVLRDAFRSTHMNDALILHDPTGVLTQVQQAVRAVFMQPYWLGRRLRYWVEIARTEVTCLQEALTTGDPLALCQHGGWFAFACSSVPLLRVGITPSSTRGLLQLGEIARPFRARLCAFEGSSSLSAEAVLALAPLFFEWVSLTDLSVLGHLPAYFAKKAVWLAQEGLYQEATHAMWVIGSRIARDCRQDEKRAADATQLATNWLQALHWTEMLETKGALARSLLKELEALAAALPSSPEV
jgi:predicted nucleotidyltransferase